MAAPRRISYQHGALHCDGRRQTRLIGRHQHLAAARSFDHRFAKDSRQRGEKLRGLHQLCRAAARWQVHHDPRLGRRNCIPKDGSRAADEQMAMTGMWKVRGVDHHSEHRGETLSSLPDAQEPARVRRPAIRSDEKPGVNSLLAGTVLSYRRFHAVPVVVQDLGNARALTNDDPSSSLQAFHQRSPQQGVLEGDAFAILIGQKRSPPAIAGVHDCESLDRLRARASKEGGKAERREVCHARRMDQLSGKLLAGIHAGVHDENAKPQLAQRRGGRATRGSSAYDECIKIGQATIPVVGLYSSLGHRMSPAAGVRLW